MSCFCDGDDPGCLTCRPNMLLDARMAFRADKAAMLDVLKYAMEGDDVALLDAAARYRRARERTRGFDSLGQARVPTGGQS